MQIINFTVSELTKKVIEKGKDYAYFLYKQSWWRASYEIHLFADNNLIAISVEGLDINDGGFIDFGASNRTRNRIIKQMQDKANNIDRKEQ
jgi:hypothetical protein